MDAARTRYELRVGTHVSKEALATFRVPVRPTAVPRHTVYRFRVVDDRDLADVLRRLIELDVEVVEIRRCPEPRRRDTGSAPDRQETAGPDVGRSCDGVVLPFRGRSA